MPAAPHVIARTTGVCAPKVSDFSIPSTPDLIIEGAGGVFVPLNPQERLIDLSHHMNVPVMLVARMGSFKPQSNPASR